MNVTKITKAVASAAAILVGSAAIAVADYQSTVLSDNPAGYWRLRNGFSATAAGSAATNLGSLGSAGNGNYAVGAVRGQAGAIIGDSDTSVSTVGGNITVADTSILGGNTNFSLEAWVYRTADAGQFSYQTIYDGRNGGDRNFRLYVGGNGQNNLELWTWAGGSWAVTETVADAVPLNQWMHVVTVLDAATGDQSIFTNGVLAVVSPAANAGYTPEAVPLRIGSGIGNFQGRIDEAAYYHTALTATDALAHYVAGTNGLGGYVAAVQANSPVGYWRLGEAPPAVDVATNLINAALNGAYINNPKHQLAGALVASSDKASAFDAANDRMEVAYSATLNPATFTAEGWFKPTAVQVGGGLVCALSSMQVASPRMGWLIFQSSSGWNFRTYNANGTATAVSITGGGAPIPNQWYHLAVSWDGSVGKLYVNGVLQATSGSTTFVQNTNSAFTIGTRSDGGFPWAGVADEVAVYSGALSDAQILAHYQNGMNASPSQSYENLVAADGAISHWRMGEPVFNTSVYEPNLGFVGAIGDGTYGPTVATTNDAPIVTDASPLATVFVANGGISIPLHEAFVRTNRFSIELWMNDKNTDHANTIRNPVWWRDEPAGGDTRGWVVYAWPYNSYGYGMNWQSSSTATTWNNIEDAVNLHQNDQWEHLVLSWDGTNKLMYLNGALVGRNSGNAQFMKLVDRGALSIAGGSFPWNGFLSEVAYYTNALGTDRITAHYVAARGSNPPPVLPQIAGPVTSVSVFEGGTVSVPVTLLGTLPFSLQWHTSSGGTPVAPVVGQTNLSLVFSPAAIANTGTYVLVVTNSAGTVTSSEVSVNVQAAPATIVTDPTSITRIQGATAVFNVVAGGSVPISYQWRSNGVNIAGATSATLTIPNIQPTFAANYSVRVSNSTGTNTSANAALTVVATTPNTFASVAVADGPKAYWRLGETNGITAIDVAGGHDGVYLGSETLGEPSGVPGSSDPSITLLGAGGIQIPFNTALNPAVAFTVECWAKVDTNSGFVDAVLVSSRNNFVGWNYGYRLRASANTNWAFTIGLKTTGTSTISGGDTSDGQWHHLVATYNDTTLEQNLYVDGQLVATGSVPASTFAPNADYTPGNAAPAKQAIGSNADDDASNAFGDVFYGGIDDVLIYDYALSPAQVSSHFGVGLPTISISQTGNDVTVTWTGARLLEATSVNGPWTTNNAATSPYVVPVSSPMKFFRSQNP